MTEADQQRIYVAEGHVTTDRSFRPRWGSGSGRPPALATVLPTGSRLGVSIGPFLRRLAEQAAGLRPAAIAAAHHICVGLLYKLFAADEHAVSHSPLDVRAQTTSVHAQIRTNDPGYARVPSGRAKVSFDQHGQASRPRLSTPLLPAQAGNTSRSNARELSTSGELRFRNNCDTR
jgi:hypothetical protein